jgi:DNA-binding protein H-NS
MTTYREFQAELQRLHQQTESVRRKEKGEALDRIRSLIVEYRLTPSDLGLAPEPRTVGTVKYRDPQTGAAWSGRGRPPRWLDGQDRARFAVA